MTKSPGALPTACWALAMVWSAVGCSETSTTGGEAGQAGGRVDAAAEGRRVDDDSAVAPVTGAQGDAEDEVAVPPSSRDAGSAADIAMNVDAEGRDATADATRDAVVRDGRASGESDGGNRDADPGRDVGGDGSAGELVQYYGRWNRSGVRAITVNSGSHVTAQFDGTAVRARFDVTQNQPGFPTVTWRIDQDPWQEGEITGSLVLGQGLAAGPHELTLMVRGLDELQSRWSPPLVSSITFLGFEVTGGALRPSTRPARSKLEFLGDSITEGVHIYEDRPGKVGNPWRADGRIAYAAQTATELGAEWRQVGFGRQGLTIGGNGGVPPAASAFDWIYAGVPRDGWQADVVIINQGTNDGAASSAAFRPLYATLLATVRAAYRLASIVALRPFNGAHQDDIRAEVSARNAAGDNNTFYVDTTGWLSVALGDFTDGVHPNPQGSTKAKTLLAAELRRHL